MAEWLALPDEERKARERKGMAAWKSWMERHSADIVGEGGPLGKTKRISESGIQDIANAIGAFVLVRANSQEDAAKMFEQHPHFTIFPGEAVEIMPVLPIPGA